MEDALEFFKENGYCLIPNALSPAEIAAVNKGLGEWRAETEGRGGSDAELLDRTTAIDSLLYHPSVFPVAQRLLSAGVRVSGLSYSPRPPKLDLEPPTEDICEGDPLCLARQWHREDSGNIEGADLNEYMAPAIQCFFYLDDVDASTHCTSVIPESAATKRSLPTVRTQAIPQPQLPQLDSQGGRCISECLLVKDAGSARARRSQARRTAPD